MVVRSDAANVFWGILRSPSSNNQEIDRERVSLAVIDDTCTFVGMEEQQVVATQLLPRPTATRKRKKRRNASEKLIEQSGVQVEHVSIIGNLPCETLTCVEASLNDILGLLGESLTSCHCHCAPIARS